MNTDSVDIYNLEGELYSKKHILEHTYYFRKTIDYCREAIAYLYREYIIFYESGIISFADPVIVWEALLILFEDKVFLKKVELQCIFLMVDYLVTPQYFLQAHILSPEGRIRVLLWFDRLFYYWRSSWRRLFSTRLDLSWKGKVNLLASISRETACAFLT
jgi:hypothetical protein